MTEFIVNNKSSLRIALTLTVVFLMVSGCADSPPTKPEVTGSIYIECEITTSSDGTFMPEIIGVVLDGDSLGYFSNPAVINDVLTGQHLLDVFAESNDVIYRSQARSIVVVFESTVTVTIPLTGTGLLLISGFINGSVVDSVRLILNGIDLGTDSCPRSIPFISSGNHNIKIIANIDTLSYEGWMHDLIVIAAETTEVDIDMVNVLPFANNHAPDITCLDAEGNMRSLFRHWGEVIFLYFFRST